MKKAGVPENVDQYIEGYPPKVQKILQTIRKTIQKAAPGAEESIRYRMPGYKLNGVLIYFAGHEKHIGMYPAPRGAKEFKKELEQYGGGKGTVQFPLDHPVPYDLITRIVKYRAQQNSAKASAKKTQVAKKKR
jgi:uncharacterized protein YdhG (YjbR/CyaY superfamily)